MNDRPSAVELLRAVRLFLERDVVPRLDGPQRYHARVAANVVAIVAREIETEEPQLRDEWQRLRQLLSRDGELPGSRDELRTAVQEGSRELVRRIRAGEADTGAWREAVLEHLRRTVADKLDVARPPKSR